MSSSGPLPERPRRRTWLWIVLALIGACALSCVLFLIWGSTAGVDTVNGWMTQIAEMTPQGERVP